MRKIALLLLIFCTNGFAQPNWTLQNLAQDFFSWRVKMQPATGDDILRVERPDGWTPDYSPEAITEYQKAFRDFKKRLNAIPQSGWSRSDSVDYLLMRSAIERVNWELNVLRLPHRNPDFYVHQTLGTLYELLLIHTPMTDTRARNMIVRLNSFPATLEHAKKNLSEPVRAFAEIALSNLQDVRQKMMACQDALKDLMKESFHSDLEDATQKAAKALENYATWIEARKSDMSNDFSVGRDGYVYFLKNIALMPYTPEELLLMGELEWNRSVAFDVYEHLRNADIPPPDLFDTAEEQIKQSRKDEEAIRRFLEEKNIMTVPDWVQHYRNKKIPPRIEPFTHMGVVDDLTSETRLDENAVSYIPEPSPDLSFFRLASAQDPRPIIIHEGVPGHYFQLVLSWANSNPIRRRFFDSGPIEGIGFYVEELMLQFGLFSDRPHTREIIYRFMRLRALRVDVDVNLALGNYSIEEAGQYLAETVPMDAPTAKWEAGFFALTPGQAISYQIGKLQILNLIADAKIKLGDKFSLRDYHDYMMENGNVPIALQRWEYLGLQDEVKKLW
ncbi:DUF885 domain-containing protein [candidate division KSB1 bacterium]|nr:DUF885 domain-containing protein [candidate division KSB1 bacterium]NIR72332.1 DUF885 domain-containing protein [candidate division KSB1 bacterium]NIS26724.1 DUF885 domain-containing protein [candidate division KSB1 bacterium]NIT73470.1 DUF885 domain-containing protein [candidate division KSB1 bacterium]NIU27339.1 DUF885 domain-containing protein [candidate division KSB1 bacterium]